MKKALIIGGSSGIGYEFIKLIKKDYYIYNISRRKCVLEDVENITFDLEKDLTRISSEIQNIEFDLFAYFAGTSMSYSICEVDKIKYKYLYEINYFKVIELLKIVVPNMIKNEKGKIILASSLASKMYIPFDTFYSSSKEALNLLSMELNLELNKYNIYSMSVLIGPTKTKFSYKRDISNKEYYFDEFEEATNKLIKLEQQGMDKKKTAELIASKIDSRKKIYIPGFFNKLMYSLYKILPGNILFFIIKRKYEVM